MSLIVCWYRSAVEPGFSYSKIKPWHKEWFRGTRYRSTALSCRSRGESSVDSSNSDAALEVNEAPALDPEWSTADCKKLEALHRSTGIVRIYLNRPEEVATTNGVPPSPRNATVVCIGRSAKYATMTGTSHVHRWTAIRESGKNWTNPLMGWTSSSDPYASMSPLTFPDESTAVSFCEKNNYSWYSRREPSSARTPITRRYENNFHWTNRCRTSTR